MSGLNEVKAGKYQLVAISWDEITSKPSEPLDFIRHHRGDVVDLNAEDAKRLVAAGAVVKPGSLEKSAVEQAKAIAAQAQLAYEAALAGLPEDVRAEIAPGTVPVAPSTTGTTGGAYDPGAEGQTEAKVLEYVGTDTAVAAAVLEQEKAGKNRAGVVSKLEAVIAGPAS